jgi:tRNA(fMet)-specific endonuclease VapC
MPYLFDTNLWIQLLKKRAPVAREKIDHLSTNEIVTCSIVKAELWHGSWKYDLPAQRQARIHAATSPYVSLAFDDEAAWQYSKLRHLLERQGNIIGPNDLKIASICLAHDLTLVTGNAGEFSRVPGLQVEDWS